VNQSMPRYARWYALLDNISAHGIVSFRVQSLLSKKALNKCYHLFSAQN
jgi:hypothetical protein